MGANADGRRETLSFAGHRNTERDARLFAYRSGKAQGRLGNRELGCRPCDHAADQSLRARYARLWQTLIAITSILSRHSGYRVQG